MVSDDELYTSRSGRSRRQVIQTCTITFLLLNISLQSPDSSASVCVCAVLENNNNTRFGTIFSPLILCCHCATSRRRRQREVDPKPTRVAMSLESIRKSCTDESEGGNGTSYDDTDGDTDGENLVQDRSVSSSTDSVSVVLIRSRMEGLSALLYKQCMKKVTSKWFF